MADLYQEINGEGDDLLVLLHGLGATASVWQGFVEQRPAWLPGRILRLDLPGHGDSVAAPTYALGQLAAYAGRAIAPHVQPDGKFIVLGHSLGGAVALMLSTSWFGELPNAAFGFGIKVAWSTAELERQQVLAAQNPKLFATEADAWERYLKVSGLYGLVDARSAATARGIRRTNQQDSEAWRLSMDPRANAVQPPPLDDVMRLARCPVHLARGSDDAMVSLSALQGFDVSARDLEDCGHNAMVDAPERVWQWLESSLQ
ncbi:MAG: alpha/beta fold hydrolase [Gammaproteobacteria bacterium]